MLVQHVAKPKVVQVTVCCDPGIGGPGADVLYELAEQARIYDPFITIPYRLPDGSGDSLSVMIQPLSYGPWVSQSFNDSEMNHDGRYSLTADPIVVPPQIIRISVLYTVGGAGPAFSFVVVGFTVVPLSTVVALED